MIYFSDVDVVVKLAACGFLPWFPELIGHGEGEVQVQYLASLKARVARSSKKLENEVHRQHLEEFCQAYRIVGDAANIDRQEALLQAGMGPGERRFSSRRPKPPAAPSSPATSAPSTSMRGIRVLLIGRSLVSSVGNSSCCAFIA